MAYRETWENEDGLEVPFGPQVSDNVDAAENHVKGKVKQMQMYVNYDELPEVGTAHTAKDYFLPNGAYIVNATFIADTDFDNAVNIGTSQEDGTAIDEDGLLAAITTTAEGSGSQIGTVVSENAYLTVTADDTAPTEGEGTLIVEYIL